MGKSIDPGKSAGAAPKQKGSQCNPAPPPIGSMSLQLAIPGQVGLHQSLSPLHQPRSSLPNNQQNEYKSSTNGELSNPNLSHGRGSPHPSSRPSPFPDRQTLHSKRKIPTVHLQIIFHPERTIESDRKTPARNQNPRAPQLKNPELRTQNQLRN